MPAQSKSLPQDRPSHLWFKPGEERNSTLPRLTSASLWLQVAAAYALIEATLWTPTEPARFLWMTLATIAILLFTVSGRYSAADLGLGSPAPAGALRVLLAGLALAAAIVLVSVLAGQSLPANSGWPNTEGAWRYAIWALGQQFILQSFFYVRLESLLGSTRAVPATAILFATAHLPSPILTAVSVLGGLFFCEMFRRYRSIYPLGLVHAMIGLTIASSLPDRVLHHMQVGIAYLHYR